MLLLTGALCAVPLVTVELIAPQDWQIALEGGPPPSGPGATRAAWKRLVRSRVELALKARGMRFTDPHPDPGGHKWDAIGIGIFAQDTHRLAGLAPTHGRSNQRGR